MSSFSAATSQASFSPPSSPVISQRRSEIEPRFFVSARARERSQLLPRKRTNAWVAIGESKGPIRTRALRRGPSRAAR